tara:strand:- start:58696 stop:60489 length:1794 start_codon:yes stop_codon:yes gene_type:complete
MHIKCFILFLVLFKYTFADQDNYFINSLRVIGNESISEEEIIFLIRQKPPNILFRRPIFDPRLLKLDALTIKNYYYTKGFLDVSIKDSYTLNDGFIDLSFEIIEGKQYFISEISLAGNKLIPDRDILSLLDVKSGETYNPVKINDNIKKVENEYFELGKLFFVINIQSNVSDSVSLNIDIKEGEEVKIQKTHFEGIEERIDTSLVSRELLYDYGSSYRKSIIDQTTQRIRDLGIFSLVNFVPVAKAGSDSLVDMVIELKTFKQREWNSTGGYDPIRFAEGAEPIPALSATIEWKNRSIFDSPTQFSTKLLAGVPVEEEFIRPRIRYDISLSKNWIFNIRFPSRLTSYYETFIEYKDSARTIERYGVQLTQNFRFSGRSYLQTNSVWESFSDNSDKIGRSVARVEQKSIGIKVFFDKRDNPLFTRKGVLFIGSFKSAGYFLGGERDYLKGDLTFQIYHPIKKRSVLAIRIKNGRIWGWNSNIPDYSYEKFYLGGSTSLRGWQILKFKELNGQPWGDVYRFMSNVEYRFPLYRSLGSTLFFDGGILTNTIDSVSIRNIEWDGGVGITINTPLGPARLDYAIQINDPKKWQIQLGVQSLF